MPQLFEVPGWRVPSPPKNTSHAGKTPKKRKRPTSDGSKLLGAEFSLEKLMDKLKEKTEDKSGDTRAKETTSKLKKKNKNNQDKSKNLQATVKSKEISRPMPLQRKEKQEKRHSLEASSQRPTKRQKTQHAAKEETFFRASSPAPEPMEEDLTPLQITMKQSLDGAKFRMINENLYKSDSEQAHSMMKEDPAVFHEYHKGFRRQVQAWPTNPVDLYISQLEDYPGKTVIADLGCGDAALAQALIPKGMTVLSFDLVSDGAFVIEADACQKIPLPGSEASPDSSTGEGQVVDVVVCALSLMNTNWPRCIREAWRILKQGGELKIAEVASRIGNPKDFVSLVCSIGFELRSKDMDNSHFTLFEFKKKTRSTKSDKDWNKIYGMASVLKPCEYKRR
ncbi:ribosomal RNA-processing protein 8 [Coprinopsis marcescibilis]|uniref:Ribosomal RNA-processing protein 8 n=1 Tax=Coprinopsis marcescibilis TaxID=230819 RepID=A0A5C3LA14_COPMA|nr:ribosomal RNA-processing protein 8 [Coprinopsis marcescibilis]